MSSIVILSPSGKKLLKGQLWAEVIQATIWGHMKILPSICRATGMEETPKAALDIQCLWRGGGVALTSTTNKFLHREVMAAHGL